MKAGLKSRETYPIGVIEKYESQDEFLSRPVERWVMIRADQYLRSQP